MRTTLIACLAIALMVGCSNPASTVTEDALNAADFSGADSLAEVVSDSSPAPDMRRYDIFELPEIPDVVPLEAVPECDPGEGCFLDPCKENPDCQSGWCVEHLGEEVCTITCQEECPPGWSCQQVAGTVPDVVFVCVSDFANLCKPCTTSEGCQSVGADDACLDYGEEGQFCGGACADESDCPWGFSCLTTVTVDGVELVQCVAETGTCPCSSTAVELGLATPCSQNNDFGSCSGLRVCTEEGLSDCDAATPAMENCDGIDNDCDGDVDEAADEGGVSVPLCDDGIECTEDLCQGEDGCSHEALNAGECKDNDACTAGDHCEVGECVGTPVVCDDDDPCTDDACDGAGGCDFVPNKADCDDGNPCTVADECSDGNCVGTPVSCQCKADADCVQFEDGDSCSGTLYCDSSSFPYQCEVDAESVVICPDPPAGPDAICLAAYCSPEEGGCSLVPDHEELACDDGNPCTLGDFCTAGVCTGAGEPNCNDGNLCTDDGCDPEQGCTHTFNQSPCNDGDVCTTADTCSDGACLGGDTLVCDDQNGCNGVESCDSEVGCLAGEPLVCDDLDPCNGTEYCDTVVGCLAGEPLDCDDGDVCNGQETCSPGFGCIPGESLVCDDSDPCNGMESCHAKAGCITGKGLDCEDGDPCTLDQCLVGIGCTNEGLSIGDCDDGNACTVGDHCVAGVCSAAGLLSCNDEDVCTADTCHPEDGCLHLLNTAPCDDGDLCTTGDACALGECQGTGTLLCDDGNLCTDDGCAPQVGCTHTPNDAVCDDGNACTLGDHCGAGWCVPAAMLDCDDENSCTDDSCDPQTGCSQVALDGSCDDGNACTIGDSCVDGSCAPGEAAECDDENVCTDDSCDLESGCVYVLNSAACSDDDLCTNGDICGDGECQPGDAVLCNDEDGCTDDSCDPANGCIFTTNSATCDDGDSCTSDDVCGDGVCAGSSCADDGKICWGGGCAMCSSLSYDGADDFVAVDGADGLEISGSDNPVTLEAWMRVDSGNQAIPIHKGSYPTYEYGFAVQDGYIDFRMNDNGAFSTVQAHLDDFSNWHHFAGVYDGESMTIYVDGLLEHRRSHSGVVAQDTYGFRIGRYGPNNGYFFKGAVGTVRVWSRALSQAELQAGMKGDFDVEGAVGLEGYWPASEGSGASLVDHSGNGYHGTISGPSWVESGPACTTGAICGDGEQAAYEECDDGNQDDGDGCSADCRRDVGTSCATILSAVPGSESGYYTIDPDSDGAWPSREVYCDMVTDSGGWTIATFRPGNGTVNDAAGYRKYCTGHGMLLAGDGVEEASSWLAQKRMLWATNHPLKKANWPHAAAYLAMPVMNKGNSIVYTIEENGPQVSLAPNLTGDHCQNVDQHYCGYWYNTGWSNADQNATPDPEDWGDVHDSAQTWFSCMFRE
jgi:hypothetical protein